MDTPELQAELQPEAQIARLIEQGGAFAFASQTLPFGACDVLDLFAELKSKFPGPSCFFQTSVESSETESANATPAHAHEPALTYFGLDVFETLTVAQGATHFRRDKKVTTVQGSPFHEIAARLAKYRGKQKPAEFFVHGGAMGHFGFESVKYVEPILRKHAGSFQISDASASAIDVELFFFKIILTFDHRKNMVTVISGFPVDEGPKVIKALTADAVRALKQIEEKISEIQKHKPKSSTDQKRSKQGRAGLDLADVNIDELEIDELNCAMGRSKYVENVILLKERIAAGDIFQAVLSERFEKASSLNAMALFRVLLRQSPSAYQFYIEREGTALLGASPEMLLSVKDRILETHPIAGTRPRGKNETDERKYEKQLSQSVKENAEHLMLVDLARNDLGRISIAGKVRVGDSAEIKKFPGVMHLVTRVYGELKKEKTAVEALGACFPAGTLSGAPKIRAMQLLSELECLPRAFYGGAVGLLSFDDELEVCIAIRCAEVGQGKITFRAGAGIVADSRPDFEYDEILHKTRSLRRAIATAEKMFGDA